MVDPSGGVADRSEWVDSGKCYPIGKALLADAGIPHVFGPFAQPDTNRAALPVLHVLFLMSLIVVSCKPFIILTSIMPPTRLTASYDATYTTF